MDFSLGTLLELGERLVRSARRTFIHFAALFISAGICIVDMSTTSFIVCFQVADMIVDIVFDFVETGVRFLIPRSSPEITPFLIAALTSILVYGTVHEAP
ncbi:hypothetical protein N7539_002319 [Penicillium diatomitis]|uniref:Uncharacterized protein n=1 Tax=Penicillium diatomitis TaxID=2819901 RepID=A0A9X0BZ32_9EURO|nr:uncharacterized protein N7539_002319 [Penicillium diatomitis]KAJ5490752.1 hypothetical protein N7539_002319 [Penicillium diatomitis]